MENKDYLKITGIVVGITAIITYGTVFLTKTKDRKKQSGRLKEDMEILGASLENKGWWLTKECQTRSLEIIELAQKEGKSNEEVKKALEIIKQKHWMTKDYQAAFKTIYDWAKTNI